MPHAQISESIELFYETAGDPDGPPVVLVAGLGVQLIDWADYFVAELVAHGHYVIRFDNRDIGLSTTFDGAPSNPQLVVDAMLEGNEPDVAYTLNDMAADVGGLLDALGIAAAHIVGVSMGGMIAQAAAIMFPERTLSLTSLMSTTGEGDVGQPTAEALQAILTPAPSDDREARIALGIETARVWGSPELFDEERLRKLFSASWDRVGGPQAENGGRHFCAIVASSPRHEELAKLTIPTLVVHGTADTLITPSGGERTAHVIPGAKLVIIEGMGHDIPRSLSGQITTAIAELVAEATPE